MSSATKRKLATPPAADSALLGRILQEGYGPGAWHGPNLKAALADVTPKLAFWRPAAGRHNIAEIALHHAFYVRSVRAQLSAKPVEPFVMEGEDWFELSGESTLAWRKILDTVESQQRLLAATVAELGTGPARTEVKPFDLLLGITCHAIYHAGQVQLIKRLSSR